MQHQIGGQQEVVEDEENAKHLCRDVMMEQQGGCGVWDATRRFFPLRSTYHRLCVTWIMVPITFGT